MKPVPCLIKYILFILVLTGCKNNPPSIPFTRPEIALLDSLQFDKSLVADIKAIIRQPFQKIEMSNQTGKAIPENLLPKMISFNVDKSFNLQQLDAIKQRGNSLGYNLYIINEQDGSSSIIISKIN
jgi:hypothetical protein